MSSRFITFQQGNLFEYINYVYFKHILLTHLKKLYKTMLKAHEVTLVKLNGMLEAFLSHFFWVVYCPWHRMINYHHFLLFKTSF